MRRVSTSTINANAATQVRAAGAGTKPAAPRSKTPLGTHKQRPPSENRHLDAINTLTSNISKQGSPRVGEGEMSVNPSILDEEVDLENEYIVNLQQQVYFLELELNLLKKAQASQPQPQQQQQSIDEPAPTSKLRSTVPSDEDEHSLREEVDAMTLAHHTVNNELQTAQQELSQRDAEIERLRRELRGQRDGMLEEKLVAEDRITSLNSRLLRKEEEYKSLMHTHLTSQAELRQQFNHLQSTLNDANAKINSLQQRYDTTDRELRETQVELMERRQAAKKGQDEMDAKWQKMVQTLKDELALSQAQLRRSELRAEAAEEARKTATLQHEKLLQENANLHSQLMSSRDIIQQHETHMEEEKRNKSTWSSTIVEAKRVNLEQQNKIQELTTQQQALRDRITGLERTLMETSTRADDSKHELERIRSDLSRMTQEQSIAEASHRQMRKDYIMVTEQQHDSEKQIEMLKEKCNKLAKERDSLNATKTHLETKLQLSNMLEQLKQQDLHSFIHSNLKVASTIESLMSKLPENEIDVVE